MTRLSHLTHDYNSKIIGVFTKMQSIINEALKNSELEKGIQKTSIVDDDDMLGQPRIVIVGCGGAMI